MAFEEVGSLCVMKQMVRHALDGVECDQGLFRLELLDNSSRPLNYGDCVRVVTCIDDGVPLAVYLSTMFNKLKVGPVGREKFSMFQIDSVAGVGEDTGVAFGDAVSLRVCSIDKEGTVKPTNYRFAQFVVLWGKYLTPLQAVCV